MNQEHLKELHLAVTTEELEEWLHLPTTCKVLDFLGQIHKSFLKQVELGATLNHNSVEATAMQTTALLGKAYGVSLVLNLKDELPQEEEATDGR